MKVNEDAHKYVYTCTSEKRPAWACASLSNDNPWRYITLKDKDSVVVATTTTDTLGVFSFPGLPVGMYTIEQTNPHGFVDVSGRDVPTNSKIMTTVVPSTLDVTGVNFVDKKAPTGAPTAPTTVNPLAPSLSGMPSGSPIKGVPVLGSICGKVTEDVNNNNSGDVPIPRVTITLKDVSLVSLSH